LQFGADTVPAELLVNWRKIAMVRVGCHGSTVQKVRSFSK
jgi:hypothetical protein